MPSSKRSSTSRRNIASPSLVAKLRRIRLVVLDVDGVLTDGRITYDDRGIEYKSFHAHDGFGISRGRKKGLVFAIITGRMSEIVTKRAEELGIREVHQNIDDKLAVFKKLKAKYKAEDDEICCIGDDELDLPMLNAAGVSAAPSDATERVRSAVDVVCVHVGGRGAVREIVDAILYAKELL